MERQHERVREVQQEMAKRLSEERSNAERRYTFQVDQLGGDLSSQWEQATKLQMEVERMKRIESDYKRELNQKHSQIDELKMELKNKTAIFMSDLNQSSAEKQSIEQEITSLRCDRDCNNDTIMLNGVKLHGFIYLFKNAIGTSWASI